MEFINQEVSGGIPVEKNSFTWTIENFDVVRKSEDYIKSQKFKFQAGETFGLVTEWMIYLTIETEKKDGKDDEKWIGCDLSLLKPPRGTDLLSASNEEVNASWQLTISERGQRNFFYDNDKTIYSFMKDGKKTRWGWSQILRQDAKLCELPLINGCLVMKLTIQLCGRPKEVPMLLKTSNDIVSLENEYKIKFLEKLAKDLGQALTRPSQQHSDAQTKIVSKDGVEFQVNRGILSARSPVFERMFQTKMSESENGIVNVNDISSNTMSIMLHFIYTGQLEADWRDSNVIAELVYAAGKYQLIDLIDFLNKVVGKVCCRDTVVDLINLTRKLSMKKAERDLMEFMKTNITSYEDMIFFTQQISDYYTKKPDQKEKCSELEVVDCKPADAAS